MDKPEIEGTGHFFRVTWPEICSFDITRITEQGRYIYAELTIKSLLPGQEGHLYRTEHNLSSASERSKLANLLGNKLDVRWADYLEWVCYHTIDQTRQDSKPQEVGDASELQDIAYRLFPLLPEKEIAIMYGLGGSGKSYLSYLMAIMVQLPHPLFGWQPDYGNVLYVDYETNAHTAERRMHLLKRGLDLKFPLSIKYQHRSRPLGGSFPELQRMIIDNNIKLLIVDSVGPAIGGSLVDPALSNQFMNGLRALDTTCLLIDHQAKNQDGANGPYGDVYKYNRARTVWQVKRHQSEGEDEIVVGLRHIKSNDDKLHKPIGLRFEFEPTAVRINRTDLRSVPELAGVTSLKDRIIGVLAHGAMNVKDIAEELDVKEANVRARLNEMKNKQVVKIGDDWGILSYDQ